MHTAALRVLGLAVAAAVLAAATQLLLVGFETDGLLSTSQVDRLVGWIRDRPREGAAILAGVALVAVASWLLAAFVRGRRADHPVLVTRRRGGHTQFDRRTLAASIGRRLEGLDRRVDVDVRVSRRGRVDLALTTPDPRRTGSAEEYRRALIGIISQRRLPCRPGRITVTTPRRTTRARTIR